MKSTDLDAILLDNVVLLHFIKKTTGMQRTILCTKSKALLTSQVGLTVLKYRPPKQQPLYSPEAYNNSIVWDLEKMDYRTVSCDNAVILEIIPDMEYLARLTEPR